MIQTYNVIGDLDIDKSNELIAKLLKGELLVILDSDDDARDFNENEYTEQYFPDSYNGKPGTRNRVLRELCKIIDSKDTYVPALVQEYVINKLIYEMEEFEEEWEPIIREYFPNGYKSPLFMSDDEEYEDVNGCPIYDTFWENLWECCFCDDDFAFLDEMTPCELQGSIYSKLLGINNFLPIKVSSDGKRKMKVYVTETVVHTFDVEAENKEEAMREFDKKVVREEFDFSEGEIVESEIRIED